ncbi:MAG: hypothetical protein ACYDCN_12240 [Bacteroidia bacterium]
MDKKMLFEVAPPFSFISKYKGLETTSTAIAVLEEEGDMELSPLWYRLLHEARTFFMKGTKI